MKVLEIKNHPIDFSTLTECKSFNEWVDSDISKAFYLGFFRNKFKEEIEKLRFSEEGSGLALLKSIDANIFEAKRYSKELARLIEPWIHGSNKTLVILDMVNDVLDKVDLDAEEDIFKIAYVLGTYCDYLYKLYTQGE